MADTARPPVTGYPAPNPNGYAANPPPPPPGTAYPYVAQPYYGNQSNPYYQPDPNAVRRATWLRRVLAVAIGLVVVFGTVVFIMWLILRPQLPDFRVDSFSLANFTLDNSSVVSFAAEVRLTARNPNRKLSLSYDQIEALIYYNSWSISDTALPPFSQGTKNDTSLTANFAAVGRFIDDSAVAGVNAERRNNGNVGFNLRMRSRVRFKAKAWRARRRYLGVFCADLIVGFPSNGRPGRMISGPRQCREGI
ncbi:NDR1/HIN1-like protein 10 [Andrographis paniculata]|uniref:NDR1/HIN1-like protein 10 n=1 Tax=Andrographis paniculata TaxID=175694 RepID=UPI0021E8EC0E|nr:NDR1/HIN1-like protein 10 [Andrographis paniculata]